MKSTYFYPKTAISGGARFLILVFLCAFSGTSSTRADDISTSLCGNQVTTTFGSNTPSSCTLSSVILGLSATGAATASVDYGAIKVNSFASEATDYSIPGTGSFGAIFTGAQGESKDSLTITGRSGVGVLMVSMTLNGTLNSIVVDPTGQTTASAQAQAQLVLRDNNIGLCDLISSGICTAKVDFVFGQPVLLDFEASESTSVLIPNGTSASATAEADYSHTATISALQIFDSNGNLISDAIVSADSGFQYPLQTQMTATPEPQSGALTAIGLLILLALGIRKS